MMDRSRAEGLRRAGWVVSAGTLALLGAWLATRSLPILLAAAAAGALAAGYLPRRRDPVPGAADAPLLHALMDAAGVPVVLLDPGGRILRFNRSAQRLSGFSEEDVRRRLFWEALVPPDDAPVALAAFTGMARVSLPPPSEIAWKTRDGDRRLLQGATLRIPAADGAPEGFLFFGIDITESRRLEGERRQSLKMEAVGRMASGLTHDLNNLLTVVMGYSDLLDATLDRGRAEHAHLEEIRSACARAAALTGQLLAFARCQVLELRVLDLNESVRAIESVLRRVLGDSIRLDTDLAPRLGGVKADPGQVEQILLNLALNARDAMPGGGVLSIRTVDLVLDAAAAAATGALRPGPHVLLTISDTGAGMNRETLAHLFEPFFTTKPPGAGTGLGLSTVYGIVRQSGGSVAVDSRPGEGARFRIHLPTVEGAASPPTEATPEPLVPGGTETLLVVEDSEPVRHLMREVLRSRGYEVLEASDGDEALRLGGSHRGRIDLLLTDIVMPRLGGHDLAGMLAQIRPDMKILFASGQSDPSAAPVPFGASHLQKPFSPAALARKVRETLDRPRLPDPQAPVRHK